MSSEYIDSRTTAATGIPAVMRRVDYQVLSPYEGVRGDVLFVVSAVDKYPGSMRMQQIRSSRELAVGMAGRKWSTINQYPIERFGERPEWLDRDDESRDVEVLFQAFAYEAAIRGRWATDRRLVEAIANQLRFVMQAEIVIPRFGSPPESWVDLRTVITQATGTLAAIGTGGNLATMLLVWAGGTVVLRIIDPIAREVGRATSEGMGQLIRKAFGLPSLPSSDGSSPSDGNAGAAPTPDGSFPRPRLQGPERFGFGEDDPDASDDPGSS
ncbi:hypothetical protein [Streptomyces sp. VRA16 Mangrove soil]|uniref:hypothetical protein n=1 Tax=Streptomyces sp. VRA16 Mangrove soil TaxID=2817434 RepID=UPI001A9F38C1|nr:hypothetical protein [Streptomyces sp. VRA16 Mangrove soil]MBO1331278.1 hypothetical protein [Streptomyces sp. VRA16 Mangrove soil]